MAKIIVLGAMKGGVGKSVSTYNLAYSLNKLGKNVLVVDFDSSANITRCVVEDMKTVEISIGDLMMNQMDEEEQPNPAEYIINRNGVDFIPSSKVLSAVDAKLRLEMGAEKILACILEPFREKYDYILIDTCPSLNTLTINALSAADEVIIAANPQFWAMVGLEDFLLTVKKIKSRVNSKLDVSGILLTMCEERTNLCKVITDEVAETFKGKLRIFDSKIPTTVKVGESVYYGEPLLEYAPRTKACRAFCTEINSIIVGNNARMTSAEDKRLGAYFVHLKDLMYNDEMGNLSDGEYDALRKKEQSGTITETEKDRLYAIRSAMKQNRKFPEKVIKYLWDDAFKFNREIVFETTTYQSLEQVIRVFMYAEKINRFSMFKENVRNAFIRDEQ